MKYLLVIGCLLFVTDVIRADEDVLEVLKEFAVPCAQEHNILPEEMPKFHDTELVGEDRNRFGCMKACIMKQTGILVGTEIQEDKYREIGVKIVGDEPDKINAYTEQAKTCFEEAKGNTDECELAFVFASCVMSKTPA